MHLDSFDIVQIVPQGDIFIYKVKSSGVLYLEGLLIQDFIGDAYFLSNNSK